MLIDWFTVAAQALNFLILVWLLKRYLYKPVLAAIDAREKRIAAELAAAAAGQAEAQRERAAYELKNQEFAAQRAALWEKASGEVRTEAQRLSEAARQAADGAAVKQRAALRAEADSLKSTLALKVQEEVFSIARKTLRDLSAVGLEERLSALFNQRLRELAGPARESLAAALQSAPSPVIVRSAVALPPPQCAAIQQAVNETFSAEIPLRFETRADLIGGIELSANGEKVGWSIASYLVALEKGVDALLKKQTASAAPPNGS